jgi:4-amino-4-deoxy-L-arabinose transferase-like glycosyltransferase
MRGNFRWPTALLVGIFIFAGGFRLSLLDRPFERDPEGCAAYYGILARNYFRFDWSKTLGIPAENGGEAQTPVLYPNHPPLTPMLIAFVDGIIGYWGNYTTPTPDWAVRLPTALATLACMLTLYLMMRHRATERAALLATAIFAALPITLYYGGLADVISPQLVFFILLTIGAYLRLHAAPNFPNLALLCAALVPAALTDWPAFHIVPVLGLHFVVTQPVRRWGWIISFGVFSVALFVLLYAHVAIVVHDWSWMKRLLVRRSIGGVSDSGTPITFVGWWKEAVGRLARDQHTAIVLLLLLGYLLTIPRRWMNKTRNRADQFATILFGWALVHILIGRQGVFVHEWWWWPLTPAAVVGSALLIDRAMDALERQEVPMEIIVVLALVIIIGCWSLLPAVLTHAAVFGSEWWWPGAVAAVAIASALVVYRVRDTLRRQMALNWIVGVSLVSFAAYNTYAAVWRFQHPQSMPYTTEELGEVIRATTAPHEAVMLAEKDLSLPLWYYADRSVIQEIWDPWSFERRLHAGTIDSPFVAERDPLQGPIGALIIPRIWAELPTIQQIRAQLADHPRRETDKFIIYDLTPPG